MTLGFFTFLKLTVGHICTDRRPIRDRVQNSIRCPTSCSACMETPPQGEMASNRVADDTVDSLCTLHANAPSQLAQLDLLDLERRPSLSLRTPPPK
ncbi:hypothetical protein J1614_000604 [Plenodomus biglobosus]|nr:hypothetical protein J1614_000604 [Plenodomus biglobosus]